MDLATKQLKKQRKVFFSHIWVGAALIAIGAFAAVNILKSGSIGVAPEKRNSLAGKLYTFAAKLMETENGKKLVPLALASIFIIIALIGLYYLIKGIKQHHFNKTTLGISILTQAKENENFNMLVQQINEDMQQEPFIFGDVYIGREWILQVEAMRLENIRGVFCFDNTNANNVLCCVDDKKNVCASVSEFTDDRDKAAKHLLNTLPSLASGGKDEYFAFIAGEDTKASPSKQDEEQIVKSLTAPANSRYTYVKTDGIPTSNYTQADVIKAISSFEIDDCIALKSIITSDDELSEIYLDRISETDWRFSVIYYHKGQKYGVHFDTTLSQALNLLTKHWQKREPLDLAALCTKEPVF